MKHFQQINAFNSHCTLQGGKDEVRVAYELERLRLEKQTEREEKEVRFITVDLAAVLSHTALFSFLVLT